MKKLKKVTLLLMVCYAIAYMLVSIHEGYTIKNEYEKTKIESYKKEAVQ